MTAHSEKELKTHESKNGREGIVAGMVLLAVGLIALLGQYVNLNVGEWAGLLVLPLIAIIFLLVGIIGRNVGFMIPGGIIGGIGLGVILIEYGHRWAWLNRIDDGAIFMLSFALGWASITLFSALFSDETHWWPLVLTAIFTLIGLGIGFGGMFMTVLTWIGQLWPLVLIALGAWLVLRARQRPAA